MLYIIKKQTTELTEQKNIISQSQLSQEGSLSGISGSYKLLNERK